MKKTLLGLLACSILMFASCANGDYLAAPDSPANGAVNPKTPLETDEFGWSGGGEPVSMKVNGSNWKADDATFVLDTTGANVITAFKGTGGQVLRLYLRDVWKNNVYPMEWQTYSRTATWGDTVNKQWVIYTSDRSNSGGVKILQNDSAVIEGKFYFKGVSINEEVVNISDGYFKVRKF
jgi:hypothetical protein